MPGRRPLSARSTRCCSPVSPRTAGSTCPERLPALGRDGAARSRRSALCGARRPHRRRCSPATASPLDELRPLAARAYGGFRHAAVAPLVQLDERLWLLELFHGPTLAFKDLALQLVGLMFDCGAGAARRARDDRRRDLGRYRLGGDGRLPRPRRARHLHPLPARPRLRGAAPPDDDSRGAANAHALAIEGNFDDCQDIVKALFADAATAARAEPVGGQLDQFRAGGGADRLLRRRRRGARRAGAAGVVQRADRQFRQCLCRTSRPRARPADRAADHRHQRERHPGALSDAAAR